MPWTTFNACLAAVGLSAVGVSTMAYRAKATMPFKVGYAVAWPTLGSAVILIVSPDPEVAKEKYERRAVEDLQTEDVEGLRRRREEQMAVLRGAAAPGVVPSYTQKTT